MRTRIRHPRYNTKRRLPVLILAGWSECDVENVLHDTPHCLYTPTRPHSEVVVNPSKNPPNIIAQPTGLALDDLVNPSTSKPLMQHAPPVHRGHTARKILGERRGRGVSRDGSKIEPTEWRRGVVWESTTTRRRQHRFTTTTTTTRQQQ